MPLFLKNKICFIHIPKCGGTTIEKAFENQLDDPPLYYDSRFRFPNMRYSLQHSPQHSTFIELREMKLIPKDFDIISFVRNPYDRFLSEYCWRLKKGGNSLIKKDIGQDDFAKIFFSEENEFSWDNHSKSQFSFLKEGFGIIKIFSIDEIDNYFINNFKIKVEKKNTTQSKELKISNFAKKMVDGYWGQDFDLLKKYSNKV